MASRIRSALFVDFDNIYIGLKQDDPRAAEEFGRGVRHWLRWVETRMPVPTGDDGEPATRSILVRRCYGNPETFANYRGWFTRNAFSVVDCPPLTGAGKNSADIVMVMDILDVLNHETHFDEFIIMSADADFTPLVLRLRAHDRRTAAIVAGNAAAAYKASCDLVVPSDIFVQRALQIDVPRSPSLQRPDRLERPRHAPGAASPEPVSAPQATYGTAPPRVAPAPAELLDAIAHRVHEAAVDAGGLPGARIPEILREFPAFTPRSNWLGFFSLRALTQELISRYPALRLTPGEKWSVAVAGVDRGEGESAGPGDVSHGTGYEPHDELGELREDLAAFIRRIGGATGAPRLTPRQYGVLFRLIAEEVEKAPYALALTASTVRERAAELGESIGRMAATFVLRGISLGGHRWRRAGVDEAPALADAFRGNLLNQVRSAQVVLDAQELALLDEWLLSGTDDLRTHETSAEAEPGASVEAVHPREEDEPSIEPSAHDATAEQEPWAPAAETVDSEDAAPPASEEPFAWIAEEESADAASSASLEDTRLKRWFDEWAHASSEAPSSESAPTEAAADADNDAAAYAPTESGEIEPPAVDRPDDDPPWLAELDRMVANGESPEGFGTRPGDAEPPASAGGEPAWRLWPPFGSGT